MDPIPSTPKGPRRELPVRWRELPMIFPPHGQKTFLTPPERTPLRETQEVESGMPIETPALLSVFILMLILFQDEVFIL